MVQEKTRLYQEQLQQLDLRSVPLNREIWGSHSEAAVVLGY
jgi:hypothetical protein